MTPDLQQLVTQTLRDPRAAAQVVLALRVKPEVIWTGLALVSVLTAILQGITTLVAPAPEGMPALLNQPVFYAVAIGASTGVGGFLFALFGRGMGGQGRTYDILALMVWLQGVYLVLQAGAMLVMLVSFALAALVNFAALGWSLWTLVVFVDEAHRFKSMFKSLAVVILASFAAVFALAILSAPFLGVDTGLT